MALDLIGKGSFQKAMDRNYIFFGVDMSSSVHVDKKKKDILILGERITQGFDKKKILTAEKKVFN